MNRQKVQQTSYLCCRPFSRAELDMLMPLSRLREREPLGLFTLPYFSTYYGVIALKGAPRPQ